MRLEATNKNVRGGAKLALPLTGSVKDKIYQKITNKKKHL